LRIAHTKTIGQTIKPGESGSMAERWDQENKEGEKKFHRKLDDPDGIRRKERPRPAVAANLLSLITPIPRRIAKKKAESRRQRAEIAKGRI
jgi:hypothetical protein